MNKKLVILLLTIVVIAIAAVAVTAILRQRAVAREQAALLARKRETLNWIAQKVDSDGQYSNAVWADIDGRNLLEGWKIKQKISFRDDCSSEFKQETNLTRGTLDDAETDIEFDTTCSFGVGEINPKSIELQQLENAGPVTSLVLKFAPRDSRARCATKRYHKDSPQLVDTEQEQVVRIMFKDRQVAERMVNAFRDAAEQCGAKGELY